MEQEYITNKEEFIEYIDNLSEEQFQNFFSFINFSMESYRYVEEMVEKYSVTIPGATNTNDKRYVEPFDPRK
jgi:hypothetical protein